MRKLTSTISLAVIGATCRLTLSAQVQPVRPVPDIVTLGFGATTSWSAEPHNGADYQSSVNNPILSVGPGGIIAPAGYTKPNASEFGSINPDGRGPAIWMRFTLATGEPIYVLYGHTANSWTDASIGVGTSAFQFNGAYKVQWQPGDYINAGTQLGYTAPFYNHTKLTPHLHISVFKPNKTCQNNAAYCTPPSNGWGYSRLHLPTGDFIDPEHFFADPQYALIDRTDPADNSIFLTCPSYVLAGRPATCSVSVSFVAGVNVTNLAFGIRVTPIGTTAALTSGELSFVDIVDAGSAINAPGVDYLAAAWLNANPPLFGTLTLGAVMFVIPATANGSYSVAFTGADGTIGITDLPIKLGPAATVRVSAQ